METTKQSRLEYQRDEHRVYLIVYHLIWCPKRRKPLLVGIVKERCQALIEAKCKEFRALTSTLPSLWTRSYFASTAGNVSKETIEQYITAQKGLWDVPDTADGCWGERPNCRGKFKVDRRRSLTTRVSFARR